MRLPNSEHEARPWRISQLAPDFRLEDVWALPAQGGADDFPMLVEVMAALDPADGGSRAASALFAIRWRVGAWLGWDDKPVALPIPGEASSSLLDRLPA